MCVVGESDRTLGSCAAFARDVRVEANSVSECGVYGKQSAAVFIAIASRVYAPSPFPYTRARAHTHKHARTHAHAQEQTHTRVNARAHARARTHHHTPARLRARARRLAARAHARLHRYVGHNLMHSLPRAAVLINDGFCGGHTVEYNRAYDCCLETSDHGPFNTCAPPALRQNEESMRRE